MNKRGASLTGQTREFVHRLRCYFEAECQNGGPLIPVERVVLRVAAAFQISRKTVTNITREKYGSSGMEDNKLKSPPRTRKRKSKKDKQDNSQEKQKFEKTVQKRTKDEVIVYAGDKIRQLKTPTFCENIKKLLSLEVTFSEDEEDKDFDIVGENHTSENNKRLIDPKLGADYSPLPSEFVGIKTEPELMAASEIVGIRYNCIRNV